MNMEEKTYKVIMWRPDGEEHADCFTMSKDVLTLRRTSGTCAVFGESGATGGGIILERKQETLLSPPQLRILFEGRLKDELGKFQMICQATAQEVEDEVNWEAKMMFPDL